MQYGITKNVLVIVMIFFQIRKKIMIENICSFLWAWLLIMQIIILIRKIIKNNKLVKLIKFFKNIDMESKRLVREKNKA